MDKKYFMGLEGFAWFVGVVEDRNDPHKLGRVRVRCVGYHTDDKTKIPTEDLPWAHVMMPTTSPSMSGLGTSPSWMVEGTWVVGFFRDIHEKQQPIIMGTLPGYPQEEANTEKGFSDPNGVYPLVDDDYSGHTLKESDINRLSRADEQEGLKHKILEAKEASRTKEVPVANDEFSGEYNKEFNELTTKDREENWEEPESPYAAKYPLNHVMETESGHIVEYDDTPDAERIQQLHKAGTFYEIDKDGTKVERIVKDKYEIVFADEYVNIKGSVNLTIGANCKTYIAGDWDIQVDGNKRETVKKSVIETYGTDLEQHEHSIKVNGIRNEVVTNNVNETYGTDISNHSHIIQLNGKRQETIEDTVTETYKSSMSQAVTGAVSETWSDTFTQAITGAVSETMSSTHTMSISGAQSITASGNTTFNNNVTVTGTTHSAGDVSTDAGNAPTLATHKHKLNDDDVGGTPVDTTVPDE